MADYAIHDTTLIGTSNIIRKKEGSSALIDPADYPKRINLMGMLEEKTQASAPVCSFDDGADDVPTSSVKVAIPPTLSGVSAVNEKQTGKTIFYPMDVEQGSISSNGSNINSTTRIRTAERKAVSPSTEYKIKVNSEVQIYEVHEYTDLTGSSTHLVVNASEYTFTTQSTTNYLRILFRYSNNATIIPSAITEIQVTDDWKIYTASLGRTIYGGEVDIVNGVGTDGYGRIIFDGSNDEIWQKHGSIASWFYIDNAITNGYVNSTENDFMICNLGTQAKYASVAQLSNGQFAFGLPSPTTYRFVFKNTDFTEVADFKAWLSNNNMQVVYRLATPTDFTFDGQEIDTMLGYNAFWSDDGDTSVAYRASGTITIIPPAPSTRNVNASIASFSDSDTSTPLLSVKSIISPTSSGISSVVFKHVGKNHIKNAKIAQGSFNADGSDSDGATRIRIRTDNYIPLLAGSYVINNKEGYEYVVYVYSSNNWQSYISAESLVSWQAYGSTFTLANDRYVRIGWRKANNDEILPSEIHDYILYDTSSLTQITANLGQTIYGGEVDAVNGTGTDEDGNDFTFTGQTINAYSGENNIYNASGNTEVEYVREVSP